MKYTILFIFVLITNLVYCKNKIAPDTIYDQAFSQYLDENYTQAASQFLSASEMELSAKNPRFDFIAGCYENIADCYYYQSVYDSVYPYFNKSLEYFRKSGDKSEVGRIVTRTATFFNQTITEDFDLEIPSKQKESITDVYFTVESVIWKNQDSVWINIQGGAFDGLYIGAKGEAYGVYSSDFPHRGNKLLGKAELVLCSNNKSTVLVNLVDSLDWLASVYEGDMVRLPAKVNEVEDKSIFYELALMKIDFNNNASDPLYHIRHVVNFDSPLLEEDILTIMQNDIIETSELIKPMVVDYPAWGEPIKEGKFEGKSMIEAMATVNKNDIASFLEFVRSFPGKYMGQTWKINETYATWLINNSPLGINEIKNLIFNAKNDGELKQIVEEYKKDILDNEIVTHINIDAENLAWKGEYQSAHKLNDISGSIAKYLDNQNLSAWVLFSKAKIYEYQEKYHDAIDYYNYAREWFKQTNDSKGVSYCMNNIASLFNVLGRYNEALQAFEESCQLKMQQVADSADLNLFQSIAISLTGKGKSLYYLGRYNEALEMYQFATEYYQQINTIEGIKGLAGILKSIGDIYKEQGNFELAILNYQKELNTRTGLGDKEGEANALDNIAYITEDAQMAKDLYYKAYTIKLDLKDKSGAGFSLSNVGQMCWTLGEYENAIESHKQALQLREEANDQSGQAYSLLKLGGLYSESGDPVKANEYYLKSIAIYDTLHMNKELAKAYKEMAGNYKSVEDYENAIQYYKKALTIYREISAKKDMADVLYELGDVFFQIKNIEEAGISYNHSIRLQKEIGDKEGQVYNLSGLGIIANYYEFEIEKTKKYYYEALNLAKETKSENNIAFCYEVLGRLYRSLSVIDSAFIYFNLAYNSYVNLNDNKNITEILSEKGYCYWSLGDFKKAEELFNESLQLAQNSNDRVSMANAYTSLSDLKRLEGNYQASLEIEMKGYQLSSEVGNSWGIAASNINFGNIYNSLGDYEKAVYYYQIADSIYSQIGIELSKATPLNNIGTIFFWQGNYEKSLEYFIQAHELLKKSNLDITFLALVKANIGEVYFEMKKLDLAQNWLDEALELAYKINNKNEIVSTLTTLVKLNIEKNSLDLAANSLKEIDKYNLAGNFKTIKIETDWLKGKYNYLIDDYKNSENYLRRAIAVSKEIGSVKYLWEPLYLLAEIQKENQQVDSSIKSLKEAIDVIEYLKNKVSGGKEAQKIFASGEAKVKVYEQIVELLMKQGRVDEALEYLERGNSENLKSKFKNLNLSFNDTIKNDAIAKEKDLKNKVEYVNEQLEQEKAKPQAQQNKALIEKLEEIKTVHQNEYISFVNDIIIEQPVLRNYFSKSENPLNFRAQKRNIPNNMAVLLYLMGEKNLYIFAGTTDSVFAKVVPINKSQLEDEIARFYSVVKNPNLNKIIRGVSSINQEDDISQEADDFNNRSESLYAKLIDPVEGIIAGKSRIAIIPNGNLYYLPFQALGKNENAGFKFLSDDFSIFYSNKLSYLFETFINEDEVLKLLAIGNADKSLPYAEEEVNKIKGLFDNSKVYIREEATKQKVFNEANFNILHFATHGILDYNNFENSYLVLAADKETGDDGKLRIDDIYSLTNIDQCQMVTLSACETAVSMEMTEGWPITTASAFLEIGIPTVIATLWSVDDEATSILMEKFYENLKTMDKLSALHKAQSQLASIDRFKHPYYWASFQLVGNWK